ncbi:hypothetical protein J4N45_16025 [Vibrio sp. SCSIO 43140]|uniref:hypothetical protein n=1 Tax=Vibrio sp. SCSIO 43140 TaxID=2819100 RepID=UPI0020759A46|nr:hypothetical protein [Vibrio sp. SCSIO 43140]USD60002.1 hypothetical protein J4N45_16025 [Vibrio sp. SCSIO 43140]
MEIKNVRKGMWVESQHGVGKVLVIDEVSNSVLVEPLGSDTQWALGAEEIEEDQQLHNGCEQYY